MELSTAPAIRLEALLDETAETLRTLPSTKPSLVPLEDDTAADAASEVLLSEATDNANDDIRPETEPERLSRLYPNSIPTTDLKHISDNLLDQCLSTMSTSVGQSLEIFFSFSLGFTPPLLPAI